MKMECWPGIRKNNIFYPDLEKNTEYWVALAPTEIHLELHGIRSFKTELIQSWLIKHGGSSVIAILYVQLHQKKTEDFTLYKENVALPILSYTPPLTEQRTLEMTNQLAISFKHNLFY